MERPYVERTDEGWQEQAGTVSLSLVMGETFFNGVLMLHMRHLDVACEERSDDVVNKREVDHKYGEPRGYMSMCCTFFTGLLLYYRFLNSVSSIIVVVRT